MTKSFDSPAYQLQSHLGLDVSRHTFMRGCGVGAGWMLAQAWPELLLARETARPALLVRQQEPFNAEPELAALVENWITPIEQFFVRNHGNIPRVDAEQFQLSIEGLIAAPQKFSRANLGEKFAEASTTATLTCAGNRRVEFADQRISGVPWDAGAIGNAKWSGVRLADVLKEAQLQPEAKHVWFEGLDRLEHHGETISFGGSIPLERAMNEGDTAAALLATHMNEAPLTPEHGAPLRALVPGYIGARSVKWLKRIVVSDKPSPNPFLAHSYKVIAADTPEHVQAAAPIYQYVLNSAICTTARNGKLKVGGYALASGKAGARIQRVELSLDGGETWQAAALDPPAADFCWQLWNAELDPGTGGKHLLIRAIDSTGAKQPRITPFNAKGYQYNGWHKAAL